MFDEVGHLRNTGVHLFVILDIDVLKSSFAFNKSVKKVLEAFFTSVLENFNLLQRFLLTENLRKGLKTLLFEPVSRS